MKKAVLVILLLLVLGVVVGVGNLPEIKERVLVGALLCDAEEGRFLVAALCYSPGPEKEGPYESSVVYADGESPELAFLRLLEKEPMLFFDHMAGAVISEAALSFGPGELMAVFEKSGVPERAGVFVIEDSCIGLADLNFGSDTGFADNLESCLKQAGDVTVFRIQRAFAALQNAEVPVLEVYEKAVEQEGGPLMAFRLKNSVLLPPLD